MEVVDLDGLSLEEEGSTQKWRDCKVETFIAIRREMEVEFWKRAKKRDFNTMIFVLFHYHLYENYNMVSIWGQKWP